MGVFGGLYVNMCLWWYICEWVSLVVYMSVGVFGGLCEWVSLVVYVSGYLWWYM